MYFHGLAARGASMFRGVEGVAGGGILARAGRRLEACGVAGD